MYQEMYVCIRKTLNSVPLRLVHEADSTAGVLNMWPVGWACSHFPAHAQVHGHPTMRC